MKKQKRKSLVEAELRMEAFLKRVGYKGDKSTDSIHSIPSYKLESRNMPVLSNSVPSSGITKSRPSYSGSEIMGITLNHKSNYEPVRRDNKQAAVDSAQMRRN